MKLLILISLLFSRPGYSQNSQISGVVYTNDTTDVVPFTLIKLISSTDTLYTTSDINGNYKYSHLCTDIFKLKVENYYSATTTIAEIIFQFNDSLVLNVFLSPLIISGCFGGCSFWTPPTAYPRGEENNIKIPREDILNLKTVDVNNRVISLSTDFHETDDQLFLRGTRSQNVTYYVDGMRQNSIPNLPRTAINSMRFNVGGLPANFGDTTSGVISIFTVGYFDLYYAWKAKQ
jgi:hypothetical protein